MVAVIGYAKSGKTSLLSEFGRAYPGARLWLNVTRSAPSSDDWWDLAVFQLASHLALIDATPAAVRDRLLDEATRRRVVVVIDDAHLLPDLVGIPFLEQAVAASNGHVAVILAGVDEPAFLDRVRSRGIPNWRVPGFTLDECIGLMRDSHASVSAEQRAALAALRERTDGHPGIVRLYRDEIQRIESVDDATSFISRLEAGLGTGPAAFHAALFQTFQSGLAPRELELCRRLAIALHGFSRRLAEALWDQETAPFADAWDGCLRRAFDAIPAARQQLPALYRDGLLSRSTATEKRAWHKTAANALSEPVNGSIDVVDAGDAVEHALLAGEVQAALHQASQFLLIPGGPHHRVASRLLLARFTRLLDGSSIATSVDWETLVRWYVALATAYQQTNQADDAVAASRMLHAVLTRSDNDSQSPAGLLGWATLMVHGALHGQVKWAHEAATHLKDAADAGRPVGHPSTRRLGLLFAYLASNADLVEGIRLVLADSGGAPLELWNEGIGFDLWRSIGLRVSQSLDGNATPDKIESACAVLQELADVARRMRETDIAIMAFAARSRIQIDHIRDFAAAVATAEAIESLGQPRDARTAAYGHHAIGNAYRCAGNFSAGVDAYRLALSWWPESSTTERAESTFMLAVSLARLGRYNDAYSHAERAASQYLLTRSSSSRISAAAHGHLEAANAALLGLRLSRALRPLIRAHTLLEAEHRGSSEWVVLAQLAGQLAQRLEDPTATTNHPCPGFTIGLASAAEDGAMEPTAPTIMLARACMLVGSPYRALRLLDQAANESNRARTSLGLALFRLDAALVVRDVERAAAHCVELLHAYENDPVLAGAPERMPFAQFQVSRVVSLASDLASADHNALELSAAAEIVPDVAGSASAAHVLRASLVALSHSLDCGQDVGLDSAFALAVSCGALDVARDLAWFWCFRHAPGRALTQGDLLKWQWRLLWVSLATGSRSADFLAAFRAQLHEWWSRLARTLGEGSYAASIRDLLCQSGDAASVLSVSQALLGRTLAADAGVAALCVAASEPLTALDDLSLLKPLRERVVTGLAELMLSPVADEHVAALSADIARLEHAIDHPGRQDNVERTNWRGQICDLRVILSHVESGQVNADTTIALLALAPLVATFTMEASAANYYLRLRFTLSSTATTVSRLRRVDAVLSSQHVADLVRSTTLPPYLRFHLGVVHYGVAARVAGSQLMDAIALIRMQRDAAHAIRSSARAAARATYERSIAAANRAVSELDALVVDFAGLPECADDVAVALLESGGARKTIGMILRRLSDASGEATAWLLAAKNDFDRCIDATASAEGHAPRMHRLRASYEARDIAEILHDEAAVVQLGEIVDGYRQDAELAEMIKLLEREKVGIGCRQGDSSRLSDLEDEEAIRKLVDLTMRAIGLPEDRREHVEQDARKAARSQAIQRDFCRYLQPLQNLEHTESPHTIYASPTMYTCTCTLLHCSTRIETSDIDVAIDAMKRNCCERCTKRLPLTLT